jgi:inner membrane transporter RhtA
VKRAEHSALTPVAFRIILLVVFRPHVHRFTAAQWRAVVPYGITIGVMNLLFYQALVRIPLGSAVGVDISAALFLNHPSTL